MSEIQALELYAKVVEVAAITLGLCFALQPQNRPEISARVSPGFTL